MPGTQNTFFHIFNHLHQHDKQIIMSSDCAPAEMEGFEARLLSRFKWGMQVELERPDIELRRDVLKLKADQDGLVLLATWRVSRRKRHPERPRTRGYSGAVLWRTPPCSNRDISASTSQSASCRTPRRQRNQVNFEMVADAVASYYGISVDLLFTKTPQARGQRRPPGGDVSCQEARQAAYDSYRPASRPKPCHRNPRLSGGGRPHGLEKKFAGEIRRYRGYHSLALTCPASTAPLHLNIEPQWLVFIIKIHRIMEKPRPLILITNDDSIEAPGIHHHRPSACARWATLCRCSQASAFRPIGGAYSRRPSASTSCRPTPTACASSPSTARLSTASSSPSMP